jgi:hypothetical protein
MLNWLRLQRREKPTVTKAETLKNVRQRTDQMLKQQDAQKDRQDEAEKKN